MDEKYQRYKNENTKKIFLSNINIMQNQQKNINEKSPNHFSKKTNSNQITNKTKKMKNIIKSLEKENKNIINQKGNKTKKSQKSIATSRTYINPSLKEKQNINIKTGKKDDDSEKESIPYSSMFLTKSNNDSYIKNNNKNTKTKTDNINSARLINKKRKKINTLNLKVIDTSDRNEYFNGSIETYTRSSNNNISTSNLQNYEKFNKSEKKRKKKINLNKLINDTHMESHCQNKSNELRKTNYNIDSNSIFSSDENLVKFNELSPTCETNRNVYDNKMKYKSKLSNENSNDLNHEKKFNYKTPILKRKIKIIHHNNKSNDFINEENNIKYIIKIQANFRRYILKKRLYNNLRIYMRYIQAIFLLKKVFLNNIILFIEKIIRKKIDKNNTNLFSNFE
jgi:hypothetical protein